MTAEKSSRELGAYRVVRADKIPWRPAMDTVLGVLAKIGRAGTVVVIRSHTTLGEHTVRNALTDLLHKGMVHRTDGRPAYYRINEYGRRLVTRNSGRFGL